MTKVTQDGDTPPWLSAGSEVMLHGMNDTDSSHSIVEPTTWGRPAAELCRVTKRYGETLALDRVDLSIHGPGLTAVLGPNGAGKTTAIKLMLGLARPTTGQTRLFGTDPTETVARRRTGCMLQTSGLPQTLQVREHISLFSSYYPRPLPLERVIEMAGLEGLEHRRFGDLSGGQQQRVAFALALCGDPDVLFLDEPTVGLDVEARRGVWQRIRELRELGKTLLLTTHYIEEADMLADRVVVLNRGSVIADGAPEAIKARVALRRIRCRTALRLFELRALGGVRQVEQDGETAQLLVTEAEPVVRALLERDPDLSHLEVGGIGLEEAFLQLTRPNHGSPEALTETPLAKEKGVA